MNPLNFLAVIAALGANAAFRIMNAARPPADYLFATFLPERNKPGYQAKSGTMTVRSTMAGLVGTDSPYPPTGIIEASTFNELTAKIANSVPLSEMAMRDLQQLLASIQSTPEQANQAVRDTVLNFLDKVVIQAHMDAMEFLRGQALVDGALAWTYGKITLAVDYGIPATNLLTARAGNDGYGGSASKFWADIRLLNRRLKGQVRAYIAHPDTIDMIVGNNVNAIRVIAQDNASGTFTVQKIVGTTEQSSSDARDRVTLIAYGLEGETYDAFNAGETKLVPFMKRGKLLAVGNPIPRGFQVGLGSTEDPQNELPIGYTHVGPTVEGGGVPGRWSRLYTPEDRPWQLIGEGVTNGLPVVEAPEKLAIGTTDMV